MAVLATDARGSLLSPAERQTLEAVCDALLPSLDPEGGDDPRFFAANAGSLGVARAIESALYTLDKSQQRQFRLLLRALEQPLTTKLLVSRSAARGLSGLSQQEREKLLLRMATSRVSQLRQGFQGLKRLATFLFYSITDEHGQNPTWPAMGYEPSANPPAIQRLLKLTEITGPTALECDVCVIGSGAGGSVVAAEMAAAGKRVVVLEAGGGYQAPDYDQHELWGMQHLFHNGGLTSSRDLSIAILAGATLGGGTAINYQTSLPLPPEIRDEWAMVSGCPHFTSDSMTRSFEAVMSRIHATAEESGVNENNAALQRGCAVLGYRWSMIERNARDCDQQQCGNCVFGCRIGGKQSAAATYLLDAQLLGDAIIVPNCKAERLVIANGRVTGVEARATSGESGAVFPARVHAPVVVVAAGALGSPLLLLRSGLELPAIGRNLYLHPVTGVGGFYDTPVQTWKGAPQTIMSDEFANLDGPYGLRLEVVPGHPGIVALASPWYGAREHRRLMQRAGNESLFVVLVRDRNGGRVRLGADGRPVITYQLGAQERAHMQRGIFEAARIHLAAGAYDLLTLHSRRYTLPPVARRSSDDLEAFSRRVSREVVDRNWATLFSAHQMGTCRTGSSRREAVCDPNGQVYGVGGLFVADASAFPASSGVNPMVTVMALAHHTARNILA